MQNMTIDAGPVRYKEYNVKKIISLSFVIMLVLVSCLDFEALIKNPGTQQARVAGPAAGDPHFKAYNDPVKFKKNPSASSCFAGELAEESKMNVLDLLNYVRKLHGLGPVTYNYANDIYAQKGAFLIALNGAMSHNPPKTWRCWSKEAFKGCSSSDIIGGTTASFTPCQAVMYWLTDTGVESLGHRRWILSPFLKTVAYGQAVVNGRYGGTLMVIGDKHQNARTDFVAYPFREYPALLFDMNWYLSFSVIQDRTNSWNNQGVDFSAAKITVTAESGNNLSIRSQKHDNQGFGVPNLLAWKVNGLRKGVRYTVTVQNVKTKDGQKDYEYWFMIK
jgi:uncharacterized protein YkwD